MEDNKKPTVTEIIDEVKADVCNRLCKYPAQYANKGRTCYELIDEQCDNCPLNRL